MGERYARLFSLPENLYAAGAPVVIAAGALLKDNQTGKVLAQLKIQNIGDKSVKAATVRIVPLDTVGKPLGETVNYQYLDLNAARDTDFGQKVPVVLPDAAARAFSVSVAEVVFVDNTVWTASETVWEPLSAPVSLEQAFGDTELATQYQIQYGENCKYLFKQEKDLWRCACGALNHESEQLCHRCQKEAVILAAMDLDELKAGKDKRLELVRQKAAEEKAAAEAKIAKTKKTAKQSAPFVIVAIILIAAVGLFASHMIKMQNYPARAFYDYVSKNGTYSEEVNLPFYTQKSRDTGTPIIFSGYAVELSKDNTPNMLEAQNTTCTIWVEEKNRGAFWYQSHADLDNDADIEFIARLTCTSEEKKLDYTCTINHVIILPDGKANIVFNGSLDPSIYHMADNVSISDMWLESSDVSPDELSDFPITEAMKESYTATVTSQTAMFLANFNSYLQGKTDVTIADFGFPDEVSTYSPNELSDKLLDTLMTQSFTEAYTQLSAMPADHGTVKEYKALIEKYLPYCGNFTEAEVLVSGEEKTIDTYTLISDFYRAPSGEVYWKAGSSDGSGNVYIGNNKHYPFISAESKQMLVDDTMTVEYDFSATYSSYHCKATFQDGEILITVTDTSYVPYGGAPTEVAFIRYTAKNNQKGG